MIKQETRATQHCENATQDRLNGYGLASYIITTPNKTENYNALMAFSSLISKAFPNITVMYFNFELAELQKNYFLHYIIENLKDLGIVNNKSKEPRFESSLRKQNRYLLVLMDNVDSLYLYPHAIKFVREIGGFGGLSSGRIVTVITGTTECIKTFHKGTDAIYEWNWSKWQTCEIRKPESENNIKPNKCRCTIS